MNCAIDIFMQIGKNEEKFRGTCKSFFFLIQNLYYLEKGDFVVANVQQSVRIIETSLEIQKDEEKGLKVIGAIYRIEDGTVEFGV